VALLPCARDICINRNQIHPLRLRGTFMPVRRCPTPQPNKDNPLHDYRNDRPGHQAGRHQ
jgi:hypothetical protein